MAPSRQRKFHAPSAAHKLLIVLVVYSVGMDTLFQGEKYITSI